MSCERWVDVPLPEVIDFQEGPGIMARDFREAGVPLIRLAGLTADSLLEGCNYLDEAMVQCKWNHFRLRQGDTIISSSASLGRVARVHAEAVGTVAYTGLIRMRPRDERVLSDYIQYLVAGPPFQRQIQAMGAGSVMRHFGPSHLKQMTVTLPPRDEQRRIVGVLGALGNKIESNRRLARLLDAGLRELYIAAARKVESRQPLSEIAAHHKASVQPSRTPQAEYEHFSIPAFDTGALSEITQGADILSGKYTFPCDAVALSKLNPATKRVLVRRSVTELPAICSSEFVVLRPITGMTTEVLYAVLAHDGVFFSELLTGVTGTTGSRQRVNPAHVLRSTVPAFDAEQISSLTDAIRPMAEQIRTLHRETVRLRGIHEALLPKLVSGQVRVTAAVDTLIEQVPAELVEFPA